MPSMWILKSLLTIAMLIVSRDMPMCLIILATLMFRLLGLNLRRCQMT